MGVRFAVRQATLDDVDGIASSQTLSWQSSYRGILPDHVLGRLDIGQRASTRRRILADRELDTLVAYDVTHRDIVGFCDAGPSRRTGGWSARAGEIYALYVEHHAKRHGLGREMVETVMDRFRARGVPALVIWVLENNHHARRFYDALGGRPGPRVHSAVGGFPVVELAYVWDPL